MNNKSKKYKHITTRVNKTKFLTVVANINVLVMNLIKFPTDKEQRKYLANIYADFSTELIDLVLRDECTREEMNKFMKKALLDIGYSPESVNEMMNSANSATDEDMKKYVN